MTNALTSEVVPPPRDPIAAVTHPDPYPYYAELVAARPLYRDEALGLWVAASAAAVTAVLTSDLCRVRPPAEPVPKVLLGSPAAEVFGRFVRMNDGAGHCPFKGAVSATLGSIDEPRAAAASREYARLLLDEMAPGALPGAILELAFRLPVHVLGSLLGIPRRELRQAALWTSDFVGCLAATAGPQEVERGRAAAGQLLELFRRLQKSGQGASGGLLAVLSREAARVGRDDADAVAANGIGFLFQAHEATAGLLGNTLRALAARPDVRERVAADAGFLRPVVQEVLRHDPPVQNTRRFLARTGVVAGREMREGDGILVLLAAANRDPAANPDPERFEALRKDRRIFTFGAGGHACPGEALAATIAAAGVEALLAAGLDLAELAGPVAYRASGNLRIPLLGPLLGQLG
jgi:cytochrome P450